MTKQYRRDSVNSGLESMNNWLKKTCFLQNDTEVSVIDVCYCLSRYSS